MTERRNNATNRNRGTYKKSGTRGGGSPARSGGRQVKSYGRRKPRYDYKKIFILAGILFLVILAIVFGVKGCRGLFTADEEAGPAEIEPEETLSVDIKINGTSIKGMSLEEAEAAVLQEMGWAMTVSFEGASYELENVFTSSLEETLHEIYSGSYDGKKQDFTLDLALTRERIAEEVAKAAAVFDVPAKDAGISSYDAASGKFLFSKEEAGLVIDREKLADDIYQALTEQDYARVVAASGVVSLPALTEEEARAQYKTIGTFTTTTTNNSDRNKNIALASEALNGQIIEKGGIFSINEATGERTTAKGYRPAGAYVNGVLVEEPGGGVCQVSSTLYNAVIFAGLNTTERYAHSYEPSYVNPGEDAMISYPSLDMKFENNTIDSIGIRASLSGTTLTISIYGIPVLEEGVTVSMHSELTETLPLAEPEYVEDPAVPFGEEVISRSGTPGTKYVTYLITKQNGVEVSREFLHNSTYRGKNPIIKVNTDPNTIGETPAGETAEGETGGSGDETVASGEGPEDAAETTAPSTEAEPTTAPETSPGPNPGAASTEENQVGPGM